MAIINDGVTIDSGLEASKMRRKMESKDTLATKGALYVGTGIPDKDLFTVTKSIAPAASDDNKVLVADSSKEVGWRIDTCPMATEATTATTVSTNIGKAKITDIFEDDGTTVKTATMAKGLQSNTAQSTGTGNTWYDFNGNSNSFGSLTFPTIIRTSEPRPKAKVKSGETTVTKEIALLEDVPSAATTWGSGAGGNLVTYGKGAGVYQIKPNLEGSPCCFAYWDGTSDTGYCSSYVSMQLDADGFWLFNDEFYIEAKRIKCRHYTYKINGGTVTKEIDRLTTNFTYRKITN